MNFLLDSHTFVWIHEEPRKLSRRVAAEIKNSANDLFLSVASVWELQIKIQIGKFKFNDSLENIIARQQLINGIRILPVTLSHVLHLKNLLFHHKDPFDRLLISQAIVENLTLLSKDPKFAAYPVNLLW